MSEPLIKKRRELRLEKCPDAGDGDVEMSKEESAGAPPCKD